jgi:hypothetical protein
MTDMDLKGQVLRPSTHSGRRGFYEARAVACHRPSSSQKRLDAFRKHAPSITERGHALSVVRLS